MADENRRVSYWQVFFDDWGLLFFFDAAILVISYTIWGLIELGTIPVSPLELPKAEAQQAAPVATAPAAPAEAPPAAPQIK